MAFLENLRSEIINQQKPSKEYLKPPGSNLVNLSEIFFKTKNKPPKLTKDQDKVHNQIFSFYNKLFAHNKCNTNLDDIRSFLNGVDIKQVTALEIEKLQEPLTKQEIANSIKNM